MFSTVSRILPALITPLFQSQVQVKAPQGLRLISSIVKGLQKNDNLIASLAVNPPKKRAIRKKWPDDGGGNGGVRTDDNAYSVVAFATAEEYDLERLVSGILKQDLYEPKQFLSSDDTSGVNPDVLYVTAKYQLENEPRDIFIFREGTVVLWNTTEMESSNLLRFLQMYEQKSYESAVIQGESEAMEYSYDERKDGTAEPHIKRERFYLTAPTDENYLEKYTFSNAMSLSVKLGIWENALESYIDSMAHITEDLRKGHKIKMSRAEMLKKTGELFELRRLINLSSNLLDTPDFYWDREHLEHIYAKACRYFSIQMRTKVMNEKLNHCVELADLISSNLNDIHHVRLEWMIIVLIMVEVVFEFIHYASRKNEIAEH